MNLLHSSGNWLLISIQELKTILTEWFQKQNEFTTEFESTQQLYQNSYSQLY